MLFITLLTCSTQSQIICTLLFPCKIRFILLVIEHICDPSNGSLNGQQESVCQPVHHDQSAPFQLQHANASGVLVLSFQSLKNDTDMGSLTLPRGVTAALGT